MKKYVYESLNLLVENITNRFINSPSKILVKRTILEFEKYSIQGVVNKIIYNRTRFSKVNTFIIDFYDCFKWESDNKLPRVLLMIHILGHFDCIPISDRSHSYNNKLSGLFDLILVAGSNPFSDKEIEIFSELLEIAMIKIYKDFALKKIARFIDQNRINIKFIFRELFMLFGVLSSISDLFPCQKIMQIFTEFQKHVQNILDLTTSSNHIISFSIFKPFKTLPNTLDEIKGIRNRANQNFLKREFDIIMEQLEKYKFNPFCNLILRITEDCQISNYVDIISNYQKETDRMLIDLLMYKR